MINKRTLAFGYFFYGFAILVHLLVILKFMPYTWINGGRSVSYDAQLQISIVSIAISFIGLFYVFANQKFKTLQTKKAFRFFKWALVPFWSFSLILQCLGTPFELFVMAPVVLIGVYAHVRLALVR